MLIDLLSTDNMVSYNVKIAQTLGLHSAIYLQELININNKALKKGKMVADKFVVDRSYITSRTTLEAEEQCAIDRKLAKIGVIIPAEGNEDLIGLEIPVLTNIMASNEAKLLADVKKLTKVKTLTLPGGKISQRRRMFDDLKSKTTHPNPELQDAYREWIEGVYANPKGFLSLKAITVFQQTIDNYAKGDLDLALKLIEIAAINGYRDATWAWNVFVKDYQRDFYRGRVVSGGSVVDRKPAGLSDEVF